MLRRPPAAALRPGRWLAVVALTALASVGLDCRSLDPQVDELFAGRAAALGAGPVTLCRLEPTPAAPGVARQCHGFARLTAAMPLPASARRAVAAVLLAPATYEWEPTARVRLCGFEPTFALATPDFEVLVSLVCDRLRVYAPGRDAPVAEPELTDAAHNALRAWLQQRFPDDPYVQLLQPN